jgi:hypothetical protein
VPLAPIVATYLLSPWDPWGIPPFNCAGSPFPALAGFRRKSHFPRVPPIAARYGAADVYVIYSPLETPQQQKSPARRAGRRLSYLLLLD